MDFGTTMSKYDKKAKLASIDSGNFIQRIKTKVLYEDLLKDVENMVSISNYQVERLLSTTKNKN